MRCPFCGFLEDKVVDTRPSEDEKNIRRRRECLSCSRRFTTYEVIEEKPLMVVKHDNRREPFSREKLLTGVMKSCEKRPVSMTDIEALVDRVSSEIRSRFEKEVPSARIGELVIENLARLDQVAYVRFASVYRKFADITEFEKEIARLKKQEANHGRD
ncbi:MAG TPA: transcriptional regulator NrdR [bacterium]|uniref:Transcriptional repressor NrdR n=1 Tax=candidate division TA06 bacterium ADurb.Bin417 TaxID=1852828 RepID=A0A1V5MHM5_UNCT6|nr:MAG: Transcriptional repressor NrdR [candidate division TA06 bacterium ADurb.Bin417]HNQ35111.1 transcriptional regulator NrdR [bacterium]HNS47943.1 transcriptional regulator NrdR [bacterium]